jgi:carotenoid cleavage dioxygenase-like enzyme
MQVWDAQTMASTPLARIAMPQRVPAGFHGLFVPHSQLPSSVAA